ncbi:MAG: hypothetical protein PS018_17315 [bacterium]|nr:hypothetical protein [bacterium]
MGFYRTGQPQALDRAAVTVVVTDLVEDELAFQSRTADPFQVDHDCINRTGHDFIGSCGEVVCIHCARIAWR